jgi:hypothetical protein
MYELVHANGLLSPENQPGRCQCFPLLLFLHVENIAEVNVSLLIMTSVIFFLNLVCSLWLWLWLISHFSMH